MDWIVWNMNQKTDINGSVVVVQPIEKGMVDCLNGQDCLYHVNLQGRMNGENINTLTRIDVRGLMGFLVGNSSTFSRNRNTLS